MGLSHFHTRDVGNSRAGDPADRWQTAEELLPQLEALATPSGGITPAGTAPIEITRRTGRRANTGVVLTVAAIALIGGAAVTMLLNREPNLIVVGRQTLLTNAPGLELDPAISPDGRTVAYAAGPIGSMHIYVRQVIGERESDLTAGLPGNH